MKMKRFFFVVSLLLPSLVTNAQVEASFENRNGYEYAVLKNFGSSTVYVEWMCVNEALGQSRHGAINLMAGYESCIGPNFNWYWQPEEKFYFTTNVGYGNNISFKGGELWWGEGNPPHPNSDGFIKTSATVSLQGHTYHIYVKSSTKYIFDKKKGWCSKW